MFELWAKTVKNNKVIKDTVITLEDRDTRTHKIFKALEEACIQFDLERPIWLEMNVEQFKRNKRTRFRQDNFIESIPFDYLEICILKEN